MKVLFFIAFVFMVIQSFLTYMQAKNFTKTLAEMRQYGIVSSGKERRYLTEGRVLILACNQDGVITKAMEMKGRTVFARFKELDDYVGLNIAQLSELEEQEREEIKKTIGKSSKQQSALSQAVGGFVDYFENKEEYDAQAT